MALAQVFIHRCLTVLECPGEQAIIPGEDGEDTILDITALMLWVDFTTLGDLRMAIIHIVGLDTHLIMDMEDITRQLLL